MVTPIRPIRRARRGLSHASQRGARLASRAASATIDIGRPSALVDSVRHPRQFATRLLHRDEPDTVARDLPDDARPATDEARVPQPYPLHRIAEARLGDGTRVRMRPLVPSDAEAIRSGMNELSERTRWLRFHSPVSQLSDAQLVHLATVDHHDREAVVAEVREEGAWHAIAVARFDRTEPAVAEIAIVVIDAWQGRGVGHALLAHISGIAREVGIERLTGEVLAENRAIVGLLDAHAERLDVEHDGTVLHTTSWLVPPPS